MANMFRQQLQSSIFLLSRDLHHLLSAENRTTTVSSAMMARPEFSAQAVKMTVSLNNKLKTLKKI